MGWGGGSKMSKNRPAPCFGSKIMNLLVFFDFEPKKCFWAPTPWGLYGSGTGAHAVGAVFSRFPYVGVFGDLSDLVVPPLRGASDNGVKACAH